MTRDEYLEFLSQDRLVAPESEPWIVIPTGGSFSRWYSSLELAKFTLTLEGDEFEDEDGDVWTVKRRRTGELGLELRFRQGGGSVSGVVHSFESLARGNVGKFRRVK